MKIKHKSLFAGIFGWAFFLNLSWEFWHSRYYTHFLGASIEWWTLLGAALFDAFWISLIIGLAQRYVSSLTLRFLTVFVGGVLIGFIGERVALASRFWDYADSMLVLPLLRTGLTPTIQLGLLGVASYVFYLWRNRLPKGLLT